MAVRRDPALVPVRPGPSPYLIIIIMMTIVIVDWTERNGLTPSIHRSIDRIGPAGPSPYIIIIIIIIVD